MIYGDHYGITDNHNRAMSEIMDEEITLYKNAELQRVPFMLKVPEVDGKGTVEEYTGNVEVVPTMLYLFGNRTVDYIHFCIVLLSAVNVVSLVYIKDY